MSDPTLKVVARMMASPDKIEEVRVLLTSLLEPSSRDFGCIRYECLQNLADPSDFTFVEEWQNEAALKAHLNTPHLQAALAKLPALLAAEPDIRCYHALSQ